MTSPTTAPTQEPRVSVKDLRPPYQSDWCPGCGDFGILNALYQGVAALDIAPEKLAVFGGIGCSGKTQYYVNTYGVHTLHGRVLPFATGAKLANPELTVIAVGGDGDGMAIGAGHFVNAGRRNVDLTYILFNNEVYGLTKGQASPTLPLGLQTKSLPEPNIQGQLNAMTLALTSGFTWIGRGYSYNVHQLVSLIKAAIEHPGLAYVEVLQPCPTYNNLHDKVYYAGGGLESGRKRLYDVADEGYDPRIPADADEATLMAHLCRFVEKAHEWGDSIPTGVFLENREITTFAERITRLTPTYKDRPPAKRVLADSQGRTVVDLRAHFDEIMV